MMAVNTWLGVGPVHGELSILAVKQYSMDVLNIVVVPAVVGIGSSIVASILFIHLYLKKKVPVILIANEIADESNGEKKEFWFKYVNKTDVPIYDVKVAAYFLTPEGAPGGQHFTVDSINIANQTYTHVPTESKTDRNALHAVQVRCQDNLLKEWTNGASFIRFEVIAKHEVSGYSKVFIADYHHRNRIVAGTFGFGNSLEVK